MDNPGHWWTLVGVTLFIVEIFTSGFVIGSLAVACLATAIFAYVGFSVEFQFIVFIVSSLVVFFGLRPFAKNFLAPKQDVQTNVNRLIGQKAIVTETIDNYRQTGRVKVDGDDWRARTEAQEIIPAGAQVTIKAVEGVTLIVSL